MSLADEPSPATNRLLDTSLSRIGDRGFNSLSESDLHVLPSYSVESISLFEDSIIQGIYMIGSLPWEEDHHPHLLFSLPEGDQESGSLVSFCIDKSDVKSQVPIDSKEKFMSEILGEINDDQIEFFTLYFPTFTNSPYYYCAKFTANSFTIPLLCHGRKMDALFNSVTNNSLPTTRICIAIRSKFPYPDLYFNFIKYFLKCELLGRKKISNLLEMFYQTGEFKEAVNQYRKSYDLKTLLSDWPYSFRNLMTELVGIALAKRFGEEHKQITIEHQKLDKFIWNHPTIDPPIDNFILFSIQSILRYLTPEQFLQMFSAIVLEKKIIIYGKNREIITNIVNSIHYIISPFSISIPILSILPSNTSEILNSHSPMIMGSSRKPVDKSGLFFLVDLEDKSVILPELFLLFPRYEQILSSLTDVWDLYAENASHAALTIRDITNGLMKDFDEALSFSITVDYNEIYQRSANFHPEIFVSYFLANDISFIKEFLNTIYVQNYIRLKCDEILTEE